MTRNATLWLVLITGFALPATADRAEDRAALGQLSGSACSLVEAVEDALEAIPGSVARAHLKRSRKPGEEPVWFYKVVSIDTEGKRQVQRFDAETCAAVFPVEPSVDMAAAIATALSELGGGFPVASRLHFPGLEPVYRIVALGPKARRVVYVDGISGEVSSIRRWNRKLDEARDMADDDDDSSL